MGRSVSPRPHLKAPLKFCRLPLKCVEAIGHRAEARFAANDTPPRAGSSHYVYEKAAGGNTANAAAERAAEAFPAKRAALTQGKLYLDASRM